MKPFKVGDKVKDLSYPYKGIGTISSVTGEYYGNEYFVLEVRYENGHINGYIKEGKRSLDTEIVSLVYV